MSHFSVFVTVPQMNPAAPIHVGELEDRLATILARYDEQTEEDEYVPAGVTVKNVDRLKHETSFHNPKNLNPDELLNEILSKYFKWLDEARV